jgi:aminoglycoside 6'-N-acetyltransferase I
MSIEIHRLNFDNASLLDRVAADVFDDPIVPAYLGAFLEDPRHVMFVAVEGDTVVGMASGFEYFHPDKPPQLFINEVGVAPPHRNRRVGRTLVAALVDFAKERSCSYAWLGTEVDNIPGQKCFEAHPEVGELQSFLLYEWDLEK